MFVLGNVVSSVNGFVSCLMCDVTTRVLHGVQRIVFSVACVCVFGALLPVWRILCVVSAVDFTCCMGYCVLCLICFVYMLGSLRCVFCKSLFAVGFMCVLCDVCSVCTVCFINSVSFLWLCSFHMSFCMCCVWCVFCVRACDLSMVVFERECGCLLVTCVM